MQKSSKTTNYSRRRHGNDANTPTPEDTSMQTLAFYFAYFRYEYINNKYRKRRRETIIENGEEVDLALARIEKEYIVLGQQVKMMITEINNNLFTLKEEQQMHTEEINDLFHVESSINAFS